MRTFGYWVLLATIVVAAAAVPAWSQSPMPSQQMPPVTGNDSSSTPLTPEQIAPGTTQPAPGNREEYLQRLLQNQPAHEGPPGMAAPRVSSTTFDAVIARGDEGFQRACIGCHDADRSFNKVKTLTDWRSTVRRMATKDGAEIASADVEPIAAYLAVKSGTLTAGEPIPPDGPARGISIFGTFSPTWRGGDASLQNSGFFPDVWLGVNIETGTPLSGRVTACITCHSDGGVNDRISLVDAVVRLDLVATLGCPCSDVKSAVEAGRFVVPFGAFSAQSNPAVYRTVTKPLIYNMGMRIYDGVIGSPVLPLPFSDEGVNLSLGADLIGGMFVNWNTYAINGLQATDAGINFDFSRDYVSNNNSPTAGTRLTLGNEWLTLGSSIMAGQSSPTGGVGPNNNSLYYRVYGADASFRYRDWVRLQVEYARRDSDRVVDIPLPTRTTDQVQGYYGEAEFLVFKRTRAVYFLMRYDLQQQVSVVAPADSMVGVNNFFVSRFTYGLNFALANASTLIFNHEHWLLPGGLSPVNVFGVRWAYAF